MSIIIIVGFGFSEVFGVRQMRAFPGKSGITKLLYQRAHLPNTLPPRCGFQLPCQKARSIQLAVCSCHLTNEDQTKTQHWQRRELIQCDGLYYRSHTCRTGSLAWGTWTQPRSLETPSSNCGLSQALSSRIGLLQACQAHSGNFKQFQTCSGKFRQKTKSGKIRQNHVTLLVFVRWPVGALTEALEGRMFSTPARTVIATCSSLVAYDLNTLPRSKQPKLDRDQWKGTAEKQTTKNNTRNCLQ